MSLSASTSTPSLSLSPSPSPSRSNLSADTSDADLKRVFKHPDGLPTARLLVKRMMKERLLRETRASQQSITASFTTSRPISYSDPAMPSYLKDLLAFNDSEGDNLETGARCKGARLEESNNANHHPQTNRTTAAHVGLSSYPAATLRNPYAIDAYIPPIERPDNMNQAYAEHTSPTATRVSRSPRHFIRSPNETSQSHDGLPATWSSSLTWRQTHDGLPTSYSSDLLGSHPTSNTREDKELLQVEEGPASTIAAPTDPQLHQAMPPIAAKEVTNKKKAPRKRKRNGGEVEGTPTTKKQKVDKPPKAKRAPKVKAEKKELAKHQLPEDVWLRIFEFTPPAFIGKARLVCKLFKDLIDKRTSVYVNCWKENFGYDMPPPPKGMLERQYVNLLGSKGCLEPGCNDKNASRTHWSWYKRWCWSCWKSKIEREDRVIKSRGNQYARNTLTKMLECIPVGMHDSFMKPHDFVDDVELRPRGAPRLYKYYLTEDIEKIIKDYEDLTPAPYVDDPNHTPAEKAAAIAKHQDLMNALEEKRNGFFAEKKAANDDHMAQVQKIEASIRKRRELNRNPYDENRNARKELFARRAREEIPHINEDFVKSTKAFKAATRIFRDGGTERGWKTLKPKIEKAWMDSRANVPPTAAAAKDVSQQGDAGDTEQAEETPTESTEMGVDYQSLRGSGEQATMPTQVQAQLRAQVRTQPQAQDLLQNQQRLGLCAQMQARLRDPAVRQLLERHNMGLFSRIGNSLGSLSGLSSTSMARGNALPLSFPSGFQRSFPGSDGTMSNLALVSLGQRTGGNGSLSNALAHSTSGYQSSSSFPPQTSSMATSSTTNSNASSSTQISVLSLLQSPDTSPTDSFFFG